MISFVLAIFLLILTPGPGVLSLAGVGAAFGWRQGFKYLIGLFLGYNIAFLAAIFGLSAIMLANPTVRTLLLFVSASYLGYLAIRIAFAGTKISFINISKPGLLTGLTFQLINPKVYAVNMTILSGFAFYPQNFAVETSLKFVITNVIWFLLHSFWLFIGIRINQLQLPEHIQKNVNIFMAISLVAVVGLSIWSILN